jgi:hypothetical protein
VEYPYEVEDPVSWRTYIVILASRTVREVSDAFRLEDLPAGGEQLDERLRA